MNSHKVTNKPIKDTKIMDATQMAQDNDLFELRTQSEEDREPMVTIFQRETTETSEEDDQLSQTLNIRSKLAVVNADDDEAAGSEAAAAAAAAYVYGDLSAVSLPRVNHFKCKWLKQTVRPDQKINNEPLEDLPDLIMRRDEN